MKAQNFTLLIILMLVFQHSFALEQSDQVHHQTTQPMVNRNPQKKPSLWQQGKNFFYAASAIVTITVASLLIHRNLSVRGTSEKTLQLEELGGQEAIVQPGPHVVVSTGQSTPYVPSVKPQKEESESEEEPQAPKLSEAKLKKFKYELSQIQTLPEVKRFILNNYKIMNDELRSLIREHRNYIVKSIDADLAFVDIEGIKSRIMKASSGSLQSDISKHGIPNSMFDTRVPQVLGDISSEVSRHAKGNEKLINVLQANTDPKKAH
jgi:hypothetical protein